MTNSRQLVHCIFLTGVLQGRELVQLEKGEGEQGSGSGEEAGPLHEIPPGSPTGISESPQNPRLPFSDRLTTCPFYSLVIPCFHTGEFSDGEISLLIRIYSQRPGSLRTSVTARDLLVVLELSVL